MFLLVVFSPSQKACTTKNDSNPTDNEHSTFEVSYRSKCSQCIYGKTYVCFNHYFLNSIDGNVLLVVDGLECWWPIPMGWRSHQQLSADIWSMTPCFYGFFWQPFTRCFSWGGWLAFMEFLCVYCGWGFISRIFANLLRNYTCCLVMVVWTCFKHLCMWRSWFGLHCHPFYFFGFVENTR